MISTRVSKVILRGLLGGGAVCVAFSLPSAGQVQTSTTEAHGESTKQVAIARGEIVYIGGNNVVVKMDDGTLRHFDNVPESTTINVDGKQLNVHQLQVGMKVERQTITTATPRVVTKVETVTGKVWQISPPNSVILTLENGQNQTFKIPKGQKFVIDGQETDAWGLKKGMKVAAQRVTEVPETVITQEIKRTGTAPPPPPQPKADVPILMVTTPPVAPAETAQAAPAGETSKKLPTTGSDWPLIGLLGALFCGLSLAAMTIRTIASRCVDSRS
jgi:hypothetical protein